MASVETTTEQLAAAEVELLHRYWLSNRFVATINTREPSQYPGVHQFVDEVNSREFILRLHVDSEEDAIVYMDTHNKFFDFIQDSIQATADHLVGVVLSGWWERDALASIFITLAGCPNLTVVSVAAVESSHSATVSIVLPTLPESVRFLHVSLGRYDDRNLELLCSIPHKTEAIVVRNTGGSATRVPFWVEEEAKWTHIYLFDCDPLLFHYNASTLADMFQVEKVDTTTLCIQNRPPSSRSSRSSRSPSMASIPEVEEEEEEQQEETQNSNQNLYNVTSTSKNQLTPEETSAYVTTAAERLRKRLEAFKLKEARRKTGRRNA